MLACLIKYEAASAHVGCEAVPPSSTGSLLFNVMHLNAVTSPITCNTHYLAGCSCRRHHLCCGCTVPDIPQCCQVGQHSKVRTCTSSPGLHQQTLKVAAGTGAWLSCFSGSGPKPAKCPQATQLRLPPQPISTKHMLAVQQQQWLSNLTADVHWHHLWLVACCAAGCSWLHFRNPKCMDGLSGDARGQRQRAPCGLRSHPDRG